MPKRRSFTKIPSNENADALTVSLNRDNHILHKPQFWSDLRLPTGRITAVEAQAARQVRVCRLMSLVSSGVSLESGPGSAGSDSFSFSFPRSSCTDEP